MSGTREPSLACSPGCALATLARRGQALAAEEAEEIRFADVEALALERGVDVAQGGPLAAELAGPVGDRITFRGRLTTRPDGCEERVDVGGASKVADDRSNSIHVKIKSLGDFFGGCRIVEISAADLVVTWGGEIGLLEKAREFQGASHGCWVSNRQVVWPRGTPWEPFGPRSRGSLSCGKRPKMRGFRRGQRQKEGGGNAARRRQKVRKAC